MAKNLGDLPFAGLKVVDAATWIAAPVAATIMADYGADVVKVEMPGGDPYRGLINVPHMPASDINYSWVMDARNKRSIALDLRKEGARDVLQKLVAWCDVFITNQTFATRRRFALNYEDLAPLNPRLIYASLTAFGERGPEAESEGFDAVAYWTRSGLADQVRAKDAPPAQALPGMGDHPSGVALYAAIATALFRRERTGEGCHVNTSLLANGYWSSGCLSQAALVGADFTAMDAAGSVWPTTMSRAFYRCGDGRYLQLYMVRADEDQKHALSVLGLASLLDDPRFKDQPDRVANGAELVQILTEHFATAPARYWVELLRSEGVNAALVSQIREIGADEQAIANNVLIKPVGASAEAPWIINHPVQLDGVATIGALPAPEIGEHTEDILAMLGLAPEAIAALRADGAI